jgi:hypothetical protein
MESLADSSGAKFLIPFRRCFDGGTVMGRAYSQDLRERVIAAVFAKPKAALRNVATRTFDALIEAIAQALADFTPRECANYLANSGYGRVL